jgi:hypothetical protein
MHPGTSSVAAELGAGRLGDHWFSREPPCDRAKVDHRVDLDAARVWPAARSLLRSRTVVLSRRDFLSALTVASASVLTTRARADEIVDGEEAHPSSRPLRSSSR